MTSTDSPAAYQKRLAERLDRAEALARRDALIANLRLGCFVLLMASAAAALWVDRAYGYMVLAGSLVFLVLVVLHDRILARHRDMLRRVAFYQAGLKRAANVAPDDACLGPPPPEAHPYAADLDLFGRGGLFALLCTAQTAAGEHALARWLLQADPFEAVVRRQKAAAHVRDRVDLREDLSGLAAAVRSAVHPDLLVRWAQTPSGLPRFLPRSLLFVCNGLLALAAVSWYMEWTSPVPFVLVALAQWGLMRMHRDAIGGIMAALEEPRRELPVLARVIERLDEERFDDDGLVALQGVLRQGSAPAARALARLAWLGDWYDASKNQVFAPIAWLLMWAPHFAHAAEGWRTRHGPRVAAWLAAVGDMEAIVSMGGYAFEHPADPFAELIAEGPYFEGRGLGHPLLPPSQAVRNDVTLGPQQRLAMVSGSNMSGKSTLLRTVGTNAVLAWAGLPVRAERLVISPVQLGATLRVQDSLQTGTSRFYAELKRLRQLMELTKQAPPLLFLLDEVLHGTNSHDRTIGAGAILRTFLARGGIGLVTTHDLAVTQEVAALPAYNVHFVDSLVEGRLAFDYRMRPGVVQKSNALALLEAMGLYDPAHQA